MAEIIKQGPYYYSTPEFRESFKGKFLSIYENKGQLKLTALSLILETNLFRLEIPHADIISIDWSEYPGRLKPFLAYIILKYRKNEEEVKTIYLTPAPNPKQTICTPIWQINRVTANWIQAFKENDELKTKLKKQDFSSPLTIPFEMVVILFLLFMIAIGFLLLASIQ